DVEFIAQRRTEFRRGGAGSRSRAGGGLDDVRHRGCDEQCPGDHDGGPDHSTLVAVHRDAPVSSSTGSHSLAVDPWRQDNATTAASKVGSSPAKNDVDRWATGMLGSRVRRGSAAPAVVQAMVATEALRPTRPS